LESGWEQKRDPGFAKVLAAFIVLSIDPFSVVLTFQFLNDVISPAQETQISYEFERESLS